MQELLWLLLPVAAASGWMAAKAAERRSARQARGAGVLTPQYVKGLNFLLNEQPDKALEVFLQMVDVDSETVETHLILGSLFRRRGEVDRAIRVHQNLIARPNLASDQRNQALLELGRDYMKAGLLDRAEGVFKELRSVGGHRLQVDRLLRVLYEQEKEWESAIEAAEYLQSHSGEDQQSVIAHYLCESAELALSSEENTRATQLVRRALSHDRSSVRAHMLLAEIAAARGDYKDAVKSYKRALEEDVGFLPVVLPSLEKAYGQLRDSDGYLRFLEGLEAGQSGGAVSLALASALAVRGRNQEARVLLEREAERCPVSAAALHRYLEFESAGASGHAQVALRQAADSMRKVVEAAAAFVCGQCGFEAKNLAWQCPSCHGWGTLRPQAAGPASNGGPLRPQATVH
jgi:lipopolysaccharide biosynthesis regulator YciM